MSLTRNLVANYLGQAWAAFMALAFLPLYVRLLGVEALGLIGIFVLLQSWLVLLDLGMTPTVNREMARFTAGGHTPQSIRDLLRTVEVVCLLLASLIALVVWGASGYLAHQWLRAENLPVDVVRQALGLMGVVVALRFCESIYRGALLGLQRHVYYNGVNALLATLRYIGAIGVLMFVSPTIWAFYLWQAAMSVVTVAVLAAAVHGSLPAATAPARASRAALAGVQRFAGGMLAITGLSLLVSQTDKLLLSRLLTLEDFGYYTLAATVAGGLGMAVAPIMQSFYPRLVALVTTGDEIRLSDTYHQGSQLVAVTTSAAMLVLTMFPHGVVWAWSGDPQLAAQTAPLLLPLAFGAFLNALMWMPYQLQLAHGWTGLTIRINTAAVAVITPAILWLVPAYGARAAAWIWVALNSAYVLVGIQLMHRRVLRGQKGRWYLRDVAAPVASATLVGLLLARLAPQPEADRLFWLAFLCFVGAATALTALLCAGTLRPRAFMLLRRLSPS